MFASRAAALVPTALLTLVLAAPLTAQEERRPITVRETLLLPSFGSYQISPDGDRIAFTRSERDPETWESTAHIWLYDIESGEMRQLTAGEKGESGPRWLEDGRILFTADRDGKSRLWVIDPDGGEAVRFIADDDGPASGTLSPDGRRLVYTKASERADKREWEERVKNRDDAYYAEKKLTWTHVHVYDLETGTNRQITSGEFDHSSPRWSPDGRWIAFVSNRTGTQMGDPDRSDNTDILLVPADSGEVRSLTSNRGPDSNPVFSPDGRWIAYTASDYENNSANQMDLRLLPVEGGEPRNLTADLDYSVSGIEWSRDGRHLYVTAAEGLTSRLYRVRTDGSAPPEPVLPDDEYVYSFQNASRDGSRWLLRASSLSTMGEVFVSDRDGRNLRHLFSETDGMKGFDVARAEAVTWTGPDGWDIEGILTYPVGYEPGTRVPLILQVHGGPHGRFARTFGTGAQVWAARGYAVLQSNPRGSSGRTFEFSNANVRDWGGKDYEDIMAGVDHVIALGVADPDRMAIMGGSYGGFMTFWAITQTARFKAAIGHAGISDWYSFYGQTDIPYLLQFGFGGTPWETKDVYERWSPVEYAVEVQTPLLITHGEQDRRVPISQAEQYYRTLKKLGRTVEFLRFPREGHGIQEPRHRLFLDSEQEAWFRTHVLGERTRAAQDRPQS